MASLHTLYAFVEGNDLEEAAPEIVPALEEFLSSRSWSRPTSLVNQIHPSTNALPAEDLPDWELGLLHELPNPGNDEPGWFSDIESIGVFLVELSQKTGRDFVIGLANIATGINEDIEWVQAGELDIESLKRGLGIAEVGYV